MPYAFDKILFGPQDVDTEKLPVGLATGVETYVLGAFNPGFCQLPNGNFLMMVRIAEALKEPQIDEMVGVLRFDALVGSFQIDQYPMAEIDFSDPRKYKFKKAGEIFALTSLSWLLPVELNSDATAVLKVHYDKMILPEHSCQEYGVEDARITKVADTYYMTACAVASGRHSTILYSSKDGLNYEYQGLILDHQNKDMVIFPEKIAGLYHALTRPQGGLYFVDPDKENNPGPGINIATSPDMLHWRPLESVLVKPRKHSALSRKVGSGAPPIRTNDGWLVLFHGVSDGSLVGVYRTLWMLLDINDPQKILDMEISSPLLEADSELTQAHQDLVYLADVVFTTGILKLDDSYILASGELDFCCRITHIPQSIFRKKYYAKQIRLSEKE